MSPSSPPPISTRCPSCGVQGRRVKPITPHSLLKDEAKKGLDGAGGYRFCKSAGCEVVYFHESGGNRFSVRDVSVPVFQKSTDPRRLVCYCFEHTVGGITEEVRRTGTSKVPDAIAEKCRQGLDRCEELNPQGACCLGNVKQVVREAAADAREPSARDSAQDHEYCKPQVGGSSETDGGNTCGCDKRDVMDASPRNRAQEPKRRSTA